VKAVQFEILKSIESFVESQLPLLKSVQDSWQPSDLLPDMADADWHEKLQALRKEMSALPDEILVVLTGNLVTEEALPSYQTWLNRCDGLRDETGASQTPWGLWTRGWTAEENRHGEVLNKYLYLSGRVNMHSIEITTQHLIRNGFDLKSDNDSYKSLIYASFQERATKISHANAGRVADKCGNKTLGRICSLIAGDEARHEEAYKQIVARIMEVDASRVVLAFEEMMKRRIVMPARLMSDGVSKDLFAGFALVAQKIGVYTARDYAEVIEHLIDYWDLASLSLEGEAASAQDYLCDLPDRFLNMADRLEKSAQNSPKESFEWIFGRTA
jgi:acyl-[acyl-carrier-protein] desaturase